MKTNIGHTKNIFKFILFTFFFIGYISCGNKTLLSEGAAIDAVEIYLKTNPIFETTSMEIGEIKFRLKKDTEKLQAYKDLAAKGYIDLKLVKQNKKFLSKDSIYIYEVKLSDKSRDFVLKQKRSKVEVKSFEYQLDEKEKAKIELTGKRSGKVIVNFKKVNTDFAIFAKDEAPHSPFITKTFKLKYKKEEGWVVTKDK